MSKPDFDLVIQVAERAEKLFEEHGVKETRTNLVLDLMNAHDDVGLNFQALVDCDTATFAHDIGGIRRHMDRSTGKLTGCFMPRTSS